MRKQIALLSIALLVALSTTSCRTAYYGVMGKFGVEKRDLLKNNVTDVKSIQEAVQGQFTSALDRYLAVVGGAGSTDLAKQYNKLDKQYKQCVKTVAKLDNKVNDFERLSRDLMKEWKKELKQYSNKEMKKSSAANMKSTDVKLNTLLRSMEQSLATTRPVLQQLSDQVLFLKHNLNSQAISGLQQESAKIKVEVDKVVANMNASIAESQKFIDDMGLME